MLYLCITKLNCCFFIFEILNLIEKIDAAARDPYIFTFLLTLDQKTKKIKIQDFLKEPSPTHFFFFTDKSSPDARYKKDTNSVFICPFLAFFQTFRKQGICVSARHSRANFFFLFLSGIRSISKDLIK